MKANMTRIAASLLVLAFIAALPVAAAGDDGTVAREKKEWLDQGSPEGRHFSFDRDLHSVNMYAYLSDGRAVSSTSFHFEARDGLYASYSSSYRTAGFGEELSAWIVALGVLEYVDSNGNGMYDPLKDKVVSTLPLSERFHYLEFIPGDDTGPTPPVPPDDGEYRKGYSIGYEIGKKWGSLDLENGLEYDPNPREHLKEYLGDYDPTSSVIRPECPDGFMKGLIAGYMSGYDAGYGIAIEDPIIEPEAMGEKTDPVEDGKPGEGNDNSDTKRPEMPPYWVKSYFMPLSVVTEKYDQDSYALSYSVEDLTGVFHAKIGIAGEIFGTGIVVPERAHFGFDIVDYPFKCKSGRLAVIAYSGFSRSLWWDPYDVENLTAEDDADYLPLWKLSGDDAAGKYKVTTWEKHEYSWKDLHSMGKTGSYGLIYSLQTSSVPPDDGTDDAGDDKAPPAVSDAKNIVDKGSILPIAVTAGIAAAVLALIAVLSIAGFAIYKKRSVW